MKRISKYIKNGATKIFSIRIDSFSFLRGKVPTAFFKEINMFPIIKKVALFLLISLVVISFIITSLPHFFLS